MLRYQISDHVNLLTAVDAESPIDALSKYAEQEGFPRYDDLAKDNPEEHADLVYTMPDGRMGAIFCNYEILATPVPYLRSYKHPKSGHEFSYWSVPCADCGREIKIPPREGETANFNDCRCVPCGTSRFLGLPR